MWTIQEKEKLIESIMSEYPIPLILLAEREKIHGYGSYEIMDGVQRLTAIFDFIENRIFLNNKAFDPNQNARSKKMLENDEIFRNQLVEDLTGDECAKFLDYQLAVTIYPAMDEKDMIDVFSRINSYGKQLSNQERRQAGVINDFATLVRTLAYEIRGDVSKDIVKLYEMPEISFDNNKRNMNYGIKPDEIFWCKNGILWANQLRDGEDEEMIVDLLASIILGEPLPKSKEKLDELYNESSEIYNDILEKSISIDYEELLYTVTEVFSVIQSIIEKDDQKNLFRNLVTGQVRNPAKSAFYAFYMACYSLLVEDEMSPCDMDGILERIKNLQSKLTKNAHYSTTEDRIKDIDLTKGLIARHFAKKEPSALSHGPGLIIGFENSLKRSKFETNNYEFKQGLLSLDGSNKPNKELIQRIITTTVAIANTLKEDGYLYIGIADGKEDAERIKELYKKNYIEKYGKFIVGIDREIDKLGYNPDQYLNLLVNCIKENNIDGPLKSQLISSIDIIDYRGFSIIRFKIPAQNKITLFNEKLFVREHNSTIEVKGAKSIMEYYKAFEGVN